MALLSNSQPRVFAVIPTWNRVDDLTDAVESLLQSKYDNLHIIVVDNGSTDGSAERMRNDYPSVQLIEMSSNKGAAIASNVGIKQALSQHADYVLRMDSDITLESEALKYMVEFAQSHRDVGMVYPKILRYDNPRLIWFIGAYYHPVFLIKGGKTQNLPDENYDEPADVDFIASAAVLLSAESLKTVGLFDERFFVYGEDTDLCLRYRKAGYRIVFFPKAKSRHKIGAEKPGNFSSYQQFRGLVIFYAKHSQGLHRFYLKIHAFLYALMRATFRKPKVKLGPALKGICHGYKAMRL